MKTIIQKLVALGERQGPTALQASDLILEELIKAGIPYSIHNIETSLPEASATLFADSVEIACAPTSFVGGSIDSKDALVSSLIPTRYLIDVSNINVNPRSPGLSRPNFYFAPSVAITRADVQNILQASDVRGTVTVKKNTCVLPQILVGNSVNPKTIVFSHFDSIGPGAIDNASGTAVCLYGLIQNRDTLEDALFVFDPNEELSYDFPTYWGHGYRVFEQKYGNLLENAKQIIVVDCVGNGPSQTIADPKILQLAFPIISLSSVLEKTVSIGGDIDAMMEVYQSDIDTGAEISENYLEDTLEMLMALIRARE